MTDEDIQQIVEADLQAGERILWHTAVDQNLRDAWIQQKLKQDREAGMFSLLWLILCGFVIIYLHGSSGAAHNTDASSYFGVIVMGGLGLWGLISTYKSYFAPESYHQERPVAGYVLTNQRLIGVDMASNIVTIAPMPNIGFVDIHKRMKLNFKWYPRALVVSSGKVRNILKWQELWFLPDFDAAKRQISFLINEQN